ncbi:hypothetical protein IV203_002203 [Nitzschia inconspicua]|uniref:Uncharacterized protein n=1 Tax=Nitzschia inconspicua TaxID=303405 RepID=A0A9K3L848_9STRA|nr:hypothetical protein IV203_002203 [Nitzschia inconspicua]
MSVGVVVVVSQTFLEGLSLDVSLLQSLLRRHRTSHGRTLYYRRMDMAVRCLQTTYNVVESTTRLETLTRTVRHQHHQRHQSRQKRKQRDMETDEEWTLRRDNNNNNNNNENDESLSFLWQEFQALVSIYTKGIQEIVSRIIHASKALFLEVSRGFFLPFCTVALSALARIRAMVLHIGRLGLMHLKNEIQPDLTTLLSKQSIIITTTSSSSSTTTTTNTKNCLSMLDFEKYMNEFLDDDKNNDKNNNIDKVQWDEISLLLSLGLSRPLSKSGKSTSQQDANNLSAISPGVTTGSNDVGVSMVIRNQASKTSVVDTSTGSPGEKKSTGLDDDRIDDNMKFVQSFKRKQQQQQQEERPDSQSKQKVKKQKTMSGANSKSSTKKEKKNKKKQKVKGNFFDDLFDS